MDVLAAAVGELAAEHQAHANPNVTDVGGPSVEQAEAHSFTVNDPVALTRGIGQAGVVEDGHAPAGMRDESRLL